MALLCVNHQRYTVDLSSDAPPLPVLRDSGKRRRSLPLAIA
jgi:hypothetical protein